MVYLNSRKGAQGIGTLIIFIALILVAAVAAGVLISTVGKLQGKAETTGNEIQERLGTGFEIIEVIINDTSDGYINNGTDTIRIILRLAAGSSVVKHDDMTVTLVTNQGIQSYSHGNSTGGTNFVVSAIGGNSTDGYINTEDVVNIDFTPSMTIGEKQRFSVRIFPGTGNPLPIALATPSAMTEEYLIIK